MFSNFYERSYSLAVTGSLRSDFDPNPSFEERKNTIMLANLWYRDRKTGGHAETDARNFATVSILYEDESKNIDRKYYSEVSKGERENGENHAERRAWAEAKKQYKKLNPRPKRIINIDIASDRMACSDTTYSNQCKTYFSPGGGATVETEPGTLVFNPLRDVFSCAILGENANLLDDIASAKKLMPLSLPKDKSTPKMAPPINDIFNFPSLTTTTTITTAPKTPIVNPAELVRTPGNTPIPIAPLLPPAPLLRPPLPTPPTTGPTTGASLLSSGNNNSLRNITPIASTNTPATIAPIVPATAEIDTALAAALAWAAMELSPDTPATTSTPVVFSSSASSVVRPQPPFTPGAKRTPATPTTATETTSTITTTTTIPQPPSVPGKALGKQPPTKPGGPK